MKTLKTSKLVYIPLIITAILAILSGCSSIPTSRQIDTATPSETSSPTPTVAKLREKPTTEEQPPPQESPSLNPNKTAINTTKVTLYTSDVQCQNFIPKQVPVAVDKPVTDAVGKILQEQDSGDFSLSGYRISINNGVATVDLRINSNSQRQMASLSSCEQFALFGSIRKTLTSNPQWNIKQVRFTERGEDIVL
ncbi:MAG: GerMN domain-containing protein [Nostocaceae cyanobacterium]|nr:GerMN domain-containing protein [Nostocaceae cyanobacterium]